MKASGESCHCLWLEEGCEERAEREDGEMGEMRGRLRVVEMGEMHHAAKRGVIIMCRVQRW